MTWTTKTSDSAAARRAGGRRGYNSKRQARAELRFFRIVDIMARNGWHGRQWGIRAKIARELGVSRATVCRDLHHFQRVMDSLTYAQEWLRFYRNDRRTNGDCFGPRPGAVFPQMDHSQKRMLRAAFGTERPVSPTVHRSMVLCCDPQFQSPPSRESELAAEKSAAVIETGPPDGYSVQVAPLRTRSKPDAEASQHQSRQ